ncbi:hypothetical protein CQY20_31980 [Mycolicibacterium agri]|uniref:Uncharacterized protein n=1 Tax=Mycolicibacterium agri TaxID=36811 RepID=A0A2A7MNX0_MYCAG|nr:hypothetical protein CQY20_31980 [Mycolicibacterium agri]GFG50147.1 hypothetical protein MAGR_15880 [Mycolicibacterium agri]
MRPGTTNRAAPRPTKQLRPDEAGQSLTAWEETHNVATITRQLNWDYGTVRKYLIAAWHRHRLAVDTRRAQ